MKMIRSFLAYSCALSTLGFAAVAAHAEDTADQESRRAAILDEFDSDGDGQLSRQEREAARGARRDQRRQGVLDQFDTDGDGRLTGDERSAARDARSARREESGREDGGRRHGGMHRGDSGRGQGRDGIEGRERRGRGGEGMGRRGGDFGARASARAVGPRSSDSRL